MAGKENKADLYTLSILTGYVPNSFKVVKSLQDICRSAILSRLTLQRLQQVADLPLPTIIKQFLCHFRIPNDFNLDGIFIDYNFNFPNHVHHKTHQIHPGRCLLDNQEVLIKSEHINEPCALCNTIGNHTMVFEEEREKWRILRHRNLMNCYVGMVDYSSEIECFVLDFPKINLQDLSFRLYLSQIRSPEFLAWQLLFKLSDVLLYLQENGLTPWELCQPQHVVISSDGEIKLENMLLYLPLKSGRHFSTEMISRNVCLFHSPEQTQGLSHGPETLVWGLGCILYEIIAPLPSTVAQSKFCYSFPPLVLQGQMKSEYSDDLQKVVRECLRVNLDNRPTLLELKSMSEKKVEILGKSYKGPDSLLNLLPKCDGFEFMETT
ncbi:hypothetical protein ACJMK2_036039 [Sinanodonta woodiana]|uniref:Protein kinase domain-containing protein n=1 Tax=Sinanodonta woodiana TaxID=1069815 RepID=A0ABD3WFZ2_SINWO